MAVAVNGLRRSLFLTGFLMLLGCTATFNPQPVADVPFKDRAQTHIEGNFKVTAAVLSAEESQAVFGLPLYRRGVQPVWLEITNNDDKPTWFLPYSVDPDYFPPLEVAYYYHRSFRSAYNRRIDRLFLDSEMGLYIAPGATRSGFVFTKIDLGTKMFNVDLVGDDNKAWTFTYFIPVPGLKLDQENIELEKRYPAKQVVDYGAAEFRNALKKLPCCVTDDKGAETNVPFNLVIVGQADDIYQILLRGGWDETAATDQPTSAREVVPGDKVQAYRYQPVTRLYFYDRDQDVSFRALRTEGLGGYVLRLWLSPMRLEGKQVWVGLVMKDIDLPAFSFKNHVLDIDEDRAYFIQNVWLHQGLEKYGFVKGDGRSTFSDLKPISKDLDYISDGYRAVLWVSDQPVAQNSVEIVDWDFPPEE